MTIAFNHSAPALIISAYGFALVVTVVLRELASYRQLADLDFTALLDKLEPLWVDGVVSAGASVSASSSLRWQKVLNDKETLRRIAGNARVLASLSRVQDNQTCPEGRLIAKQIWGKSLRIMLWAVLLQWALPDARRVPGAGRLVRYLNESYLSAVHHLQVYYSRRHARQGAALKRACNFSLCSNTA